MNADIAAVLNFRKRGHAGRIERLRSLGAPVDTFDAADPYAGDREALAAWGRIADDRDHEAAGGVYFACTARESNGVDRDLPTSRGVGCRITRVPVRAYKVEAGDVLQSADGEGDAVIADEGCWHVCYAAVGTGWMAPGTLPLYAADTAEEATNIVRTRLLASGECFATRDEARDAVERMLRERTARPRDAYEWASRQQGFDGSYADWQSLSDDERDEYERGAAGMPTE